MTDQPDAPTLLADAPLALIAAALRSGEEDLRAWIERVCDRAEAIEPALRSLLPEPERRERLLREVAGVAERWPDPADRPPLYGVPVGVKDIIAVDGLPLRAGSAVPAESLAMPEAAVVRRLRDAGAIVLGKTVTTEFAYFDPGPTVNPHDPHRTPGGSSSGSAAAVAAGLTPLALGSQTVGSVVRPAAFCGVVGVKPTRGRIPLDGVLPYSASVDTLGYFTQDLAGARLVAPLICDEWRDAGDAGARRPVIGVPRGPYLDQCDTDARAMFDAQLSRLEQAGLEVRRVDALSDVRAVSERHRALITREFARVHAERFAAYGSLFRPMSAMQMDAAAEIPDSLYEAGQAGRDALHEEFTALMDEHEIDLWASPAAPGAAPIGLQTTGSPAMNLPWTHAGMPAITIPAAALPGDLPLGLQLTARRSADEQLLAWSEVLWAALGDVAARV